MGNLIPYLKLILNYFHLKLHHGKENWGQTIKPPTSKNQKKTLLFCYISNLVLQ